MIGQIDGWVLIVSGERSALVADVDFGPEGVDEEVPLDGEQGDEQVDGHAWEHESLVIAEQ